MSVSFKVTTLAVICLFIASCSQDGVSFNPSSGAGITLHTASSQKNFANRELYTSLICRNAGVPLNSSNEFCNYSAMDSGHWQSFVYTGVYDIDQRCDAYLTWINNLRRSRKPIIEAISDYAEFTGNILKFADVSEDAIAIVSAVFGMARKSFTRVSEIALLTELDNSALFGPVLRNQAQIKEKIRSTTFTSKAQAMHALRDYLRTCMPYVMINNVNATLSEFGKTGQVSENEDFTKSLGFAAVPKADDKAGTDRDETTTFGVDLSEIFSSGNRSPTDIVTLQKGSCIEPDGIIGDNTKAAVLMIEQTHADFSKDSKLSDSEWPLIESYLSKGCDTSIFKNYYEFAAYGNGSIDGGDDKGLAIISALTRTNGSDNMPLIDPSLSGKTLEDGDVREAIKTLREKLNYRDEFPGTIDYTDHLTPGLIIKAFPN